MISDLKPYLAYKDSGLPWLGQVPADWEMRRSKYLFREVDQRSVSGREMRLSMSQQHGLIPSSQIAEKRLVSESNIGGKLCQTGDLVLNRLKAHLGVLAVSPTNGLVSPDYTVLRPIGGANYRYFCAVYRSPYCGQELRRRAKGIVEGFWRLYTDDFYDIRVPVPSITEQAAIVRFLDWAHGRLDRAMRAKRQVVALLNEQKRAIIHRAVTRGLNPSAPLKSSGVPWLGDIPKNWDSPIKLKHISSLKGRLGWQGLKANEYSASGPAVVSSAHFRNQMIEWDKCPHVSQERYEMDINIQLSTGDILLMKDGAAMGKLAFVDDLPAPACLNSHLVLFRPLVRASGPKYDPKFLFYFMLTSLFQDYVKINGTGATFLGVSQEALGNYKICLPPIDDQRTIARFLDIETKTQDKALALVEHEITLLREYRTRLVADVVTGRLDVRDAAAKLPGELAPDPTENDTELEMESETDEEEAAL